MTKESAIYRMRIRGHLDRKRLGWLDGLDIKVQANGETMLVGSVADQGALHGILVRIRDLGLPLLSLSVKQVAVVPAAPVAAE